MSLPRQKMRKKPRLTVIRGEGRSPSPIRQAAVYYLILALTGVLIFLVGYHWVGTYLISRRLQQVVVRPGHLDYTVAVDGVITCQEEVIVAPCAGVLAEIASPGERVLKDAVVARIFPLSRAELKQVQPEQPREESLLEQFLNVLRRFLKQEGEEEKKVEAPAIPPSAVPVTGEAPPWLGEGEAVTALSPGLLSLYVDGWEGISPLACLRRRDEAAVSGSAAAATTATATSTTAGGLVPLENGAYVDAGQPLLKIVDNWRWHYTAVLPLGPGHAVAAREQVSLTFAFAPENPVEGFLEAVNIDEVNEVVYLTYRIERDLAGFSEQRWAGAEISYQRLHGLLVPTTALNKEADLTVVYINQSGVVRRFPVDVLGLQDDRAVVEGFPPYSLVITKPGLVREGQRIDY